MEVQETGPGGLCEKEVARRFAIHGPNRLPEAKSRGPLRRFIDQFNNLLILLLLGSAAVAGLLGHWVDAGVIIGVVVINAIVGFIQEGKAESAMAAIRNMLQPLAAVLRDGHRHQVDAAGLVPGDIVLLEAGDRVPADMRLLRAQGLKIDEAPLTGESVPVEKQVAAVAETAVLADRACMAYSGTLVTAGQGQGLVVATGLASELGRISSLIQSVGTMRSPLLAQMDRFARELSFLIIALSALLLGVALLMHQMALDEAFLVVIGIAVAAIPEGLPAVLTITLAIGVQRMAGRHAIIRRLAAVETLGSVDVICSDKTGTLTRNEMIVDGALAPGRAWQVAGIGYDPTGDITGPDGSTDAATDPLLFGLAQAALLCNDAALRNQGGTWQVAGDPMEGALLAFAMKAGLEPATEAVAWPRRDVIPFDAGHRFMATLHDNRQDRALILVKGAPERLIEICQQQQGPGGLVPLDRGYWHQAVESFAAKGQRVLAFATQPMPFGTEAMSFSAVEEGSLVLLGLVGLIDPPRMEAMAAIAECHSAGIAVKMITGDHALTAAAIARQLGLKQTEGVVTGRDLAAMDDAALAHCVRVTDVFARTTPEDKLRLVRALQAGGRIVAMTGDGVNDAPALKTADVGIAMGQRGTEAAKEAAEMVLADDNFTSIVAAVREGRTVGDNVRKVIAWTLPTNGGEALCMITALAMGTLLPMTAVQILWVNMVTAILLGLTLAFEPMEPGAMARPPGAKGKGVLDRFLVWRIALTSVLMLIGVKFTLHWMLARGAGVEEARTLVVNALVAMEIFYLFSVRYLHMTSLTWTGLLGTPAVLIGVAGTVLLQLAFTYLPLLNDLFGTRPLSLGEGAMAIGTGIALLLLLEMEKLIRHALRGKGAA
jgi:magnesium-transporting ATPase (P-type)